MKFVPSILFLHFAFIAVLFYSLPVCMWVCSTRKFKWEKKSKWTRLLLVYGRATLALALSRLQSRLTFYVYIVVVVINVCRRRHLRGRLVVWWLRSIFIAKALQNINHKHIIQHKYTNKPHKVHNAWMKQRETRRQRQRGEKRKYKIYKKNIARNEINRFRREFK